MQFEDMIVDKYSIDDVMEHCVRMMEYKQIESFTVEPLKENPFKFVVKLKPLEPNKENDVSS